MIESIRDAIRRGTRTPTKAGRKGGGTGAAIGGILAGFDQLVFRTLPPAQELVHHARPDDPVPAEDGGLVRVLLPEELPVRTTADEENEEEGSRST